MGARQARDRAVGQIAFERSIDTVDRRGGPPA